jgi:hypothetical protein
LVLEGTKQFSSLLRHEFGHHSRVHHVREQGLELEVVGIIDTHQSVHAEFVGRTFLLDSQQILPGSPLNQQAIEHELRDSGLSSTQTIFTVAFRRAKTLTHPRVLCLLHIQIRV